MLLGAVLTTGALPLLPAQQPVQTPPSEEASPRRSLSVGDLAPSIAGVKWVKGEGVDKFESGTIYVLDFMATWCGPCVQLMPHMSELAERHKDDKVRVLGLSVWESSRPLGNHSSYEEKVRAFAQKHAKEMRYDAGFEGDDAPLARSWMQAANRVSIPTVFIVGKDGAVAWIGHPSMGVDEVVTQLVAGTFDAAAHEKMSKERETNRLKGMQIARRLQEASNRGEHERAMQMCEEILALDPVMFAPTRISMFRIALTGLKDAARAEQIAREAIDQSGAHAGVLASIAGVILLDPKAERRDLALASSLLDRMDGAPVDEGARERDTLIARLESALPRVKDDALRMQIEAQLRAHKDPESVRGGG
jgi:thiol-disulfide isomerase/thioredoxin